MPTPTQDQMGNFGVTDAPVTPAPAMTAPVAAAQNPGLGSAEARTNPYYLGPTAFGNIQRQYTPYQIEQATTRDNAGNIFWKQGVDIGSLPASAPVQPFTSPSPSAIPAPSTSNVTTSSPGPASSTTLTRTPEQAFGEAQSQAARQYLTGIQTTLDDLTAKQQEMIQAQKKVEQSAVNSITDRFKSLFDSTQYQDRLQKDRDLFQVQSQISTLNTIRQKIADSTSALEQGLIYEAGRPVRRDLMTGRMDALRQQGLAQISAFTTAAEVVKGNIDLAEAYADRSVAALKADNADRINALNVVLDLHKDNLVRLTEEESKTIDYRKKLLESEATKIDKNKDQVFGLISAHPDAATRGGVTFLDSPERALQKMSQYLAEADRAELQQKLLQNQLTQSQINENNAQARKAASGGSGSGTGGNSLASLGIDASLQSILDRAYVENIPLDQVIADVGGPSKFTAKQLNALQDFWSSKPKAVKPEEPTIVKDLTDYGINPVENPEMIGATLEEVKAKLIKDKPKTPSKYKWFKPWTYTEK